MSDQTLRLLDEKISEARDNLDVITRDIEEYRTTLAGFEVTQAVTDGHLRNLMHLRAVYTGEAADLAPGDVRSAEDVMGLTIGGLSIAPPEDPTEEDLAAYADTMRALYDQAQHQAVLATEARLERAEQTTPDVLVATGVQETQTIPAAEPDLEIDPAAGPPTSAEGRCIHCHDDEGRGRPIVDFGGGWVHIQTAQPKCWPEREDSPYAQPADPFSIALDPEDVEQPRTFRVTFDKLGRRTDITPLEGIKALDREHLAKLIAVDAAHILDVFAETLAVEIALGGPDDEMTGIVSREDKVLGTFTVEEVTEQ